jgi:glycosyltransferase involved in cell wall biosynthesis
MENSIILSILIPAYEYPEGISRLLHSLHPWNQDECEVIISDDSVSVNIVNEVSNFIKSTGSNIELIPHKSSYSAANNWNNLINNANGEYLIIMHHDEFPYEKNFTQSVISKIFYSGNLQVGVMNLILLDDKRKWSALHFPAKLKVWIVKNIPKYIFYRNVIGPTGVLIVKKSLYPKFNEDLRWFVDVECYYRIFVKRPEIQNWDDINIVSLINRGDGSITGQMTKNKELKNLKTKERGLILDMYGDNFFLYKDKIIIFETILWYLFRVIQFATRIAKGNIIKTRK